MRWGVAGEAPLPGSHPPPSFVPKTKRHHPPSPASPDGKVNAVLMRGSSERTGGGCLSFLILVGEGQVQGEAGWGESASLPSAGRASVSGVLVETDAITGAGRTINQRRPGGEEGVVGGGRGGGAGGGLTETAHFAQPGTRTHTRTHAHGQTSSC